MSEVGAGSTPRRRAPRPLPVVLLADVSGSMEGEKIALLNQSVAAMFSAFARLDSVRGQVHVAAIGFGGEEALVHTPLTPAPEIRWTDMDAGGRTPMGHAFELTRELLEDPTTIPERAFQPTLVLVSDGAPTDDWESPLAELLASRRGAKAFRLAVGIGVDRTGDAEQVLTAFCTPGWSVLRADQVHEIPRSFRWITATVTGQLEPGFAVPRLEDLDV